MTRLKSVDPPVCGCSSQPWRQWSCGWRRWRRLRSEWICGWF